MSYEEFNELFKENKINADIIKNKKYERFLIKSIIY